VAERIRLRSERDLPECVRILEKTD